MRFNLSIRKIYSQLFHALFINGVVIFSLSACQFIAETANNIGQSMPTYGGDQNRCEGQWFCFGGESSNTPTSYPSYDATSAQPPQIVPGKALPQLPEGPLGQPLPPGGMPPTGMPVPAPPTQTGGKPAFLSSGDKTFNANSYPEGFDPNVIPPPPGAIPGQNWPPPPPPDDGFGDSGQFGAPPLELPWEGSAGE